jgi:ABC-type branched-subunit amino acid transport system ATPase component
MSAVLTALPDDTDGTAGGLMLHEDESEVGVPALAVEGLSVAYGGFRAVNEVSFAVPAGEIHGLIGPNGAGKTTCFNAICGYLRPTGGRVYVNGTPLAVGNPRAAWRVGIARTFQKTEMFWTLTVREHMDIARRRAAKRGLTPPPTADLVRLLGIGGQEERIVANLSLGTTRLVELGRALATGAKLILLDEPCSGLDQAETARIEAALRTIQEDLELSMLIVEHDMEFILSIAKNIFVLDSGQLIASGTPPAIRRSEVVQRAYLGGTPEQIAAEAEAAAAGSAGAGA